MRTSATRVPGRAMRSNSTASTASRTITSGGSSTRPSSTAGTAPSTVFSIGTKPGVDRARAHRGEHGGAARARHQLGVRRLRAGCAAPARRTSRGARGSRCARLDALRVVRGKSGRATVSAHGRRSRWVHANSPSSDSCAVGSGSRSTPQRDTSPRTPLTRPLRQAGDRGGELGAVGALERIAHVLARQCARHGEQQVEDAVPARGCARPRAAPAR